MEVQKAWELGATKDQMKEILQDIRHAQWRMVGISILISC